MNKVFPMAWHKFLCCFALWIEAFRCLVFAIAFMTGIIFGENPDRAYELFAGIKSVNFFAGIAFLGLAILGGITAVSLLNFKAIGPKLLIVLNITYIVVIAVYLISISKLSYNSISNIRFLIIDGLVVSIVLTVLNKIYYDKRKALFIK